MVQQESEMMNLGKSLDDISDLSTITPSSSIPFPLHQCLFDWTVINSSVLTELVIIGKRAEGINGLGHGLRELGI